MSGFAKRPLGKTGLWVSPIGIGGGMGLSSQNVLYAFEQGINYFFFSSDLHHFLYRQSAEALRTLCQRGSSVREQVVLATVTYLENPEKVPGILLDQFVELGVEYIDVFHWGWITDHTDLLPLIKLGQRLKRPGFFNTWMQDMQRMTQTAREVNADLLQRGLVRYVGASFHSRGQARAWMRNLDVLMLRYNIAHTGIERDVVPFLFGEKSRDPGIVVFNVAHDGQHHFHLPPPGYAPDQYIPTIPDCYRFALTHPWVDLVMTGPVNRSEIDQALAALEKGPLSAEEYALIRDYGAGFSKAHHAPGGGFSR